jgi:hypothetical protein
MYHLFNINKLYTFSKEGIYGSHMILNNKQRKLAQAVTVF